MSFKLKIKYPNCNLQVGDVVTKEHCLQNNVIPENYPEIWQKVEELKYEILSFRCVKKDLPFGVTFGEIRPASEEKHAGMTEHFLNTGSCVKNGDWEIYSIKRLSDNVVFSIGDVVEHVDDKRDKGTISKIGLSDISNMCIWFGDKFMNNFRVLKHSKQKLFTTNDNVDIYEGDKYWFIFKFTAQPRSADGGRYVAIPNYYFSTKEKAEKYILENKPCLSLKDLCEFIPTYIINSKFENTKVYGKLIELIKTKL